MPVLEKSGVALPPEALNLPTVKYPDEVVERWVKEVEIARMQIAVGELKPQTADEFAAQYGISLDD